MATTMTRRAFSATMLAVLAGAGCGVAGAGFAGRASAQGLDRVTIGTTTAIETATAGEYAYDMLASGVSELPLVYQDTQGAFHPLLASYATEDSQTWTYTIVEGMTWSDGEPVSAEDILFTLQYEDASGSANFVDQTDEKGKETKAKYAGWELSEDGASIALTLAAPNVRELSNMTSLRLVPKHVYEGKETLSEEDMRVSCGPYVLESFGKDSGTLTFVPNEFYPATPNVASVAYQIFGSEDVMYLALQNGEIDMVWNYSQGVPGTYQDVLAESEGVALINVPAANEPAVLAFNNENGLFSDGNLRRAVSWALDYEAFKAYFGSVYAETPARGFVPSSAVGYKETERLAHDVARAEEFMAAAGYTEKGPDGFYLDGEGKPLGFELTVNADKEAHLGYAELVKSQLDAFGIQVTLDAVDADSYNAKTSNKFSENNITMEAAIYGYTAAGMGMGNGLGTIYVDGTHAVQGGCQVFDETFREILAELGAASTLDEYVVAAGKVQDWYAEETPLIALYWDNMMYAYSTRLTGLVVDYTFGLNNANTWFSIGLA